MSDLTGKFAALRTQLANQHTALMGLLTDIHTDSSALAQTLPTIRDTLGDVHLDTQSMDLKLLAIRDEQADIHLDTQSIDLKLLDVRNTLTYIYSQVLNLAPGTFDWAAVMGTPSGSADNVLAWLAQTIDSLGQPTGDATTTVLGRLSAIETLSFNYLPLIATNTGKCPCGASPPATDNICSDPYVSTGMWLAPVGIIPGVGSFVSAVWDTAPPSQIEYGTIVVGFADHSSLMPVSGQSWVGRSIFVESSADNFALQTASIARYPTNTWVDLTPQATAEITVMVDAGASVRAYICGDLGYGPGGGGGGSWGGGGGGGSWGGDCVTFESSFVSAYGGQHVITVPVSYLNWFWKLTSSNRIDTYFPTHAVLSGGETGQFTDSGHVDPNSGTSDLTYQFWGYPPSTYAFTVEVCQLPFV